MDSSNSETIDSNNMIKSFVDFLDESPKSFDELYRKLDLEPSEPIRDQYQFNEPTTKPHSHIKET